MLRSEIIIAVIGAFVSSFGKIKERKIMLCKSQSLRKGIGILCVFLTIEQLLISCGNTKKITQEDRSSDEKKLDKSINRFRQKEMDIIKKINLKEQDRNTPNQYIWIIIIIVIVFFILNIF